MSELAIASMVCAGMRALRAGAPSGVALTIRRRAITATVLPPTPDDAPFTLYVRVVARHVVEWGDPDGARGAMVCDVVVPPSWLS